MSRKVIVAVDGGPASDAALGWAIERSRVDSADLELTAVVDPARNPHRLTAERLQEPFRAALDHALDRVGAEVSRAGASSTHAISVIHHGSRIDELVNASGDADLIVIGSDRTGALTGLLHGTMAQQLAEKTRCPLVVVPVGWTDSALPVVVGQGDETDEAAVAFAAAEAQLRARSLHIVRAWDIPPIVATYLLAQESFYDEVERTTRVALAAVAAQIRAGHPGLIVEERVENAQPAVALVEAAAAASLAVVGTHRRGPVGGLLLGSVGHALLMAMSCPVAIVPPAGDEPVGVRTP